MAAETHFCSSCGHELSGDDRFCGECGAPVEASGTPSGGAPPPPMPAAAGRRGLSGPVVGGVAAVVAAAAIGGTLLLTGGDEPAPPPSSTAVTTVAGGSTTLAGSTTASAVTSLTDVRGAVIQIVATGTFVEPDGVRYGDAGAGSGFFIDQSGLAVTNNHVVTGAATLEVYLDGEDRPRNAYVVAASECSDLAVIDVDGDGYQFLDWYSGDISVGLPVFAAGFPLGDPEYTLQEGIVSKESAGGESSWASVDAVIEHSAATLPGNSGGPLVTEDGHVVGINYAGNQAGQEFAISAEIARPVVAQLVGGEPTDSIGVNGEAVTFDDGTYGIWVYSVDSGSPADSAGILPGDLLWTAEDIDLAADGTMSSYCDVLRSHAPGAALAIEVFRPETGEILAGQVNGRPIEVVFTIDAPEGDATGTPATEVEYVDYYDSSGYLYVRVPSTWVDVEEWTFDLFDDGTVTGPAVTIATDVEAFYSLEAPGVLMVATWGDERSLEEILDFETAGLFDYCMFDGREPYDDDYYVGVMDVFSSCDPAGATYYAIAAYPPGAGYQVSVYITAISDADFAAVGQIIRTFSVYEGE